MHHFYKSLLRAEGCCAAWHGERAEYPHTCQQWEGIGEGCEGVAAGGKIGAVSWWVRRASSPCVGSRLVPTSNCSARCGSCTVYCWGSWGDALHQGELLWEPLRTPQCCGWGGGSLVAMVIGEPVESLLPWEPVGDCVGPSHEAVPTMGDGVWVPAAWDW